MEKSEYPPESTIDRIVGEETSVAPAKRRVLAAVLMGAAAGAVSLYYQVAAHESIHAIFAMQLVLKISISNCTGLV